MENLQQLKFIQNRKQVRCQSAYQVHAKIPKNHMFDYVLSITNLSYTYDESITIVLVEENAINILFCSFEKRNGHSLCKWKACVS